MFATVIGPHLQSVFREAAELLLKLYLFVAINVADSHRRCIGLTENNNIKDIRIGNHVFIGSHSVILGGADIGHHSVIGAGSVVRGCVIPPFSLVLGDVVKPDYFRAEYEAIHGTAQP